MNWQWTENLPVEIKDTHKAEYECARCHRKLLAYPGGYLPLHRHKGKRVRCDASGSAVHYHKKV